MTAPTAEGLRRYPDTQGYFHDMGQERAQPDHDLPCTCQTGCPARCAGDCGCKACDMAFAEFADVGGFYVNGVLDEVAALARYRGG